MRSDMWALYALMLKSRLFEEAIAKLWHEGLISGEMHHGTGEEAIVAGVVSQLREGDAMALDHRGSAALIMRGVDPRLILRELLGRPDGLCGSMGGHMHLFSREHLAASSGIVGAGGPTGAGFALAAQVLRPGSVSIAFIGEGAMNQGMLMESLNLAAVWNLPLVFVCKDDDWSITTRSGEMTGRDLRRRVEGLGVPVFEADGRDVRSVWEAAGKVIDRARSGRGPGFLLARCVHLEGHFLGLQTLRIVRHPFTEIPKISAPLISSFLHSGGASLGERWAGLKMVLGSLLATLRDPRTNPANDPLRRTRTELRGEVERLEQLEGGIEAEVRAAVASALAEVSA